MVVNIINSIARGDSPRVFPPPSLDPEEQMLVGEEHLGKWHVLNAEQCVLLGKKLGDYRVKQALVTSQCSSTVVVTERARAAYSDPISSISL